LARPAQEIAFNNLQGTGGKLFNLLKKFFQTLDPSRTAAPHPCRHSSTAATTFVTGKPIRGRGGKAGMETALNALPAHPGNHPTISPDRGFPMEQPILVRDLQPHEMSAAAATGDTLPDGSVLLKRSDMNRMGLEAARDWIMTRARAHHVIAIGDEPLVHPHPSRPDLVD
jgi:hypothetical protein